MKKGILPLMRIGCVLLLTLSSGCVQKEFDERVSTQISSVSQQTEELYHLINQPGSYPLVWKDALQLLDKRNLDLNRSRQRSEEILRERNEQWKNWVPRPSVFANLNSSLADLGKLSFTDLNASVVAPLSIPNPLTERARAFENALSYLESKDSLELTYRRNVISLFRIYSQASRVEDSLSDLQARDDKLVSSALSRLEEKSLNESTLRSLQSQLVQLLNIPGSKPMPVTQTRPNINYENKFRKFIPGRNYGMIAVRLSAYRIEAALLSEKGVRLRKWPTLSISGSTPSLYDTRGNQDITNAERIFLFGGLSKSYDLVGADVDSVETARENTEFVKQNLRLLLDRDMRDWKRLQDQYNTLVTRKRIASERLARIRKGKTPRSPIAELAVVRKAASSLARFEDAKEQLDLELWMWDDNAWN